MTDPTTPPTLPAPRRAPALAVAAAAVTLLLTACGSGDTGQASGAGSAGVASAPTGTAGDAADQGTGDATSGDTFAFEHVAGTTQVPVDPQRIVTLTDQNALLPLLELGVVPAASGGVLGDDGAPQFRRVEDYDTSEVEFIGDFFELNLEAVAQSRPDLLVGYEFTEQYEELSQIAPTGLVQIFDRPLTDALLDFAELVGEEEQGQERLAAYEARIADLQEALSPVRDELSVSVIAAPEAGQFGRADDGQALGTVMADLDLLRPAPQQGPPDVEEAASSLELLPQHDADVVVLVDFSGEGEAPGVETLLGSPVTQNLASVRADQLHVIDGTRTVGAAWGKMDAFLDELERVLVTEQPDPAVVAE